MKCPHLHGSIGVDPALVRNERRTLWVVYLTAAMMIVEIGAGTLTGSMALLADGWHMASHAGALFIAFIAYRLSRSPRVQESLSFGAGKAIPLGGYTSAVILAMIAVLMAFESIHRLFNPQAIQFKEAIVVAVVGLVVNIVSAMILHVDHDHGHDHGHDHDHDHGHGHSHGGHDDHNLRSAYIHVIADALTSVLAIAGLFGGSYFGWNWLDPLIGLLGSAVILKWAFNLCRDTGWELLDGHYRRVPRAAIIETLEASGARVADLHVWRVGPSSAAAELVVEAAELKGADYYRALLSAKYSIQHIVVEERKG